MSLRSTILKHSLPLLPKHSFTRQTISIALSSLNPSDPDYKSQPLSDATIDTVLGEGPAAAKALVNAWEEEGIQRMQSAEGNGGQADNVKRMLRRRLEYSAEVGEHLVEAHAILSAPSSSRSLPIPTLPIPLKTLLAFRIPRMYTPPGSPLRHANTALSASQILHSLAESSGGRLPLLSVNPLGPLGYAWRIADQAVKAADRAEGVKKGVMNEPVGAGPEHYTSRLGLSLAYLSAEARLLQPYPTSQQEYPENNIVDAENSSPRPSPYLDEALQTLDRNIGFYASAAKGIGATEKTAGDAMGYLQFIGRSWAGLFKSRYW